MEMDFILLLVPPGSVSCCSSSCTHSPSPSTNSSSCSNIVCGPTTSASGWSTYESSVSHDLRVRDESRIEMSLTYPKQKVGDGDDAEHVLWYRDVFMSCVDLVLDLNLTGFCGELAGPCR